MASEVLINVRPNQTRVAYIENGTLSDLKVERKTSPTLVGSIYRGKVLRVLPGMQAAFVDIGLDKAAFLYVGDVRENVEPKEDIYLDEDVESKDVALSIEEVEGAVKEENRIQIQDLLEAGQLIMAQVAKDPLGTKGARITTHISLPSRNLVYMPTIDHLGISRKIENEEEKERLKNLIEEIDFDGGVIVRTAAEKAQKEKIAADLEYLSKLWKDIEKSYKKKKSIGMVFSEVDVELRALRDLLNEDVKNIFVDDEKTFKKIGGFLSQYMSKYKNLLTLYNEEIPIFDKHDIDLEISRSLDRKVWLKSGGYIVIDEAEALVVIDVNTGRFVGKKDLEDTILKTNLEAVREIVQQLRIRNCGGIIIIDFIDMEKEINKEKLLSVLAEELKKDRSPTTIVSMSDLGLVEMTRKRIRPSLVSTLCEPCSYCEGKGYIKKKITVANEIFRALERLIIEKKRSHNIMVLCHSDIADWIYEEDSETLDFVENKLGETVSFKVEPSFHIEEFEIRS